MALEKYSSEIKETMVRFYNGRKGKKVKDSAYRIWYSRINS
ncbi:hypothetical protein [uncultured Ilyobacter sp.]|nr:hypothetical protein [uncultured Ilyobacter sp.]